MKLTKNEIKLCANLAKGDHNKFIQFAKRRLSGEPLAYIAGSIKFLDNYFLVDPRVYIPNHETESLVKELLKELKPSDVVMDVGTGCGLLAITTKKHCPRADVHGVDILPYALDVARENAKLHKVNIKFHESHYVDSVPLTNVDLIIADMPHGNPEHLLDSSNLQDLAVMPSVSVFHPQGSLQAYSELIKSIQHKKWHCKLFIETGKMTQNEIAHIIPKNKQWEYKKLLNNYSISIINL